LGIFGEKIKPPVGLHFFNFTDDVPAETQKNKGQKYLDAGHINAIILIPHIATILNAKLQNKTLQSMVNDENNAKIANTCADTNIGLKLSQITRYIQLLCNTVQVVERTSRKNISSIICWGMIKLYRLRCS
jgi:hypothetical protein